ncbi:hypothetical protein Pcinc_014933 [Petrolisthes cinctipes]|uniref:Beta-galactosidase n=1 Tax=Petrolisthes cinctipes TaxID=88211 RepID=A0AAE1FUE7_PETCI|nr:hypothetical protein Pcinc_014933 [Petrolisthes cinctipes]
MLRVPVVKCICASFFVLWLIIAVSFEVQLQEVTESGNRSFTIDYDNNQFLKDGQPFRYVSGSIHYFRVLAADWPDRLKKLRMAGFNAVQTVVEWSTHEPEPGNYLFTENQDLENFIMTAQEQDLYVILRVGPYICAERDMGGLPYWLLKLHPNIRLRTSDPAFLNHVDAWMGVLLPRIRPLLYENGGPVIMVQVENEYGSSGLFQCDYQYTSHLRQLFRHHLGSSLVLFTVDNPSGNNLRCGKIPEVYATVDFGLDKDPGQQFEQQRLFEPRGPLVNSEFYPGWIDHWGEPHHTTQPEALVKGLDAILALNASVNMYMFHGGTSFGLTSGSNVGSKFQSCPTSYDYDAPVSEAGDPTDKYPLLREVIGKYLPLPHGPLPPTSPKGDYGKVALNAVGSLKALVSLLPSVTAFWPQTFEELGVTSGLVIYSTTVPMRMPDPARLALNDLHDRAYVLVNGKLAGTLAREGDMSDLPIYTPRHATLDLVVESQGRVSIGRHLNDFKGLTTNVTLNGHVLMHWQMTALPLTDTSHLHTVISRLPQVILHSLTGTPRGGLTMYSGMFNITDEDPHPLDTFLKLDGWGKGIAWVNDFCLGRYWPDVGPQVTLYVPGAVMHRGDNTLLLLELERAPCDHPDSCFVTLQNHHQINGPTPPEF